MGAKRVTIKDVARASGVSPTTVSFVLNSTRGQTIPEATRERVRDAAHALGYVANGIGRALREGTSRVVLLNVGLSKGGPALEGFIHGMSEELASHGYSLLVQHGIHDHALQTAIASISPRTVVNIAEPFAADDPDNPEGGAVYGMVSHTVTQLGYLVKRGHTHLAFALPALGSPFQEQRQEHVIEVTEQLGINTMTPFRIGKTRDATAEAITRLCAALPKVTAIAAFDDETALAILAALPEIGLTAPTDLAVIGFGDSAFGELWAPTLTSVHIDSERLGEHAARVALAIEDQPVPSHGSRVIVRESA